MSTNTKKYQHEWEKRNKDKRRIINNRHRAKVKQWYDNYKSNLICKKCGENHPACLEFHHINPKEKEYEVSRLMARGTPSISALKKEIAKCDILCANCHRKEHAVVV